MTDLYVNVDAAEENLTLASHFRELCQHPVGDPSRNTPVAQILEYLRGMHVLRRWALSLVRRYSLGAQATADIEQTISLGILEALRTFTEDDVRRANALYMQNLFQVSRSAVTRYLESADATGLTGASGHVRRQMAISVARRTLASSGNYDPTNEDIIEHIAQRNANSKSAVKSGRVVEADDFDDVYALPVDWTDEGVVASVGGAQTIEPYDSADLRIEMSQAVRALSQYIHANFPDEGDLLTYAHSWMRFVYDGEQPTAVLIAKDTGLSADTIPALSRKFRYAKVRFRRDVDQSQIAETPELVAS